MNGVAMLFPTGIPLGVNMYNGSKLALSWEARMYYVQ